MQGEGAAWQTEQARNGGEGQEDAGALEPHCGDRVRFQWQCADQHTSEKRSRKRLGSYGLMALSLWQQLQAPWNLPEGGAMSELPGGPIGQHPGTTGRAAPWGGPQEPGASTKPALSREKPFPGAQERQGGSCCHPGSHCRCLNREQDGGKPSILPSSPHCAATVPVGKRYLVLPQRSCAFLKFVVPHFLNCVGFV